ncbi:MAG: O-antigen ligase family protein [Chthoniobacteraceae bacterium]
MKLERLQEYVLPVVVTLLGMGFAVYTGSLMGQGRFSTVALLLGLLFMGFLTLIMRQYIWLLIIVAWPWPGSIPVLPVPFAVRDLGVMAAAVSFLALMALKIARRRPGYGIVDVSLAVLLIYMLTVLIRNPVGFLSTNSFRVGGRPYFNIAIACAAYFVLSRASIPVRSGAKLIIFTILASNYVVATLNIIADLSPRAARVLVGFYTGLAVDMDVDGGPPRLAPGEAVERLSYLGNIGIPTSMALASFYRPLTLVNPLYLTRFLALALCAVCVMLSGFRSSVLAVAAFILIATYLRSGWTEIVRLLVVCFFGLILAVAGQGQLYDLPLSVQRSLSFLPGKWSPVAKASADESTEWRLTMWKQMLSSNKYIQSRLFGDGFGVTKRDMAIIAMLSSRPGDSQETIMILGTVHSGPISTIRVAGYVGLVLHLALLALLARKAWELVRKSANTPFHPLAFFFGLPLIYEPFNYVFIFGGFDSSVPAAIYGLATLKLLENSVDDFRGTGVEAEPVSHRRIADPERMLAGAPRA